MYAVMFRKAMLNWYAVSGILVISTCDLSAQTLASGPQILTFFSSVDDTEQPYCIYIPKNFDEEKEYPLVVMLHGAGSNHRMAMRRVFGKSNIDGETDVEGSQYFPEFKDVDMIVASPYARGTAGYQDFIERDVLEMLADVKKRFAIDENRIYLTGLSMGGGGTLWIGWNYPDIWAAIAPVCPGTPLGIEPLAPNALNMAVRFVHGAEDPVVPVQVSRDLVDQLKVLQTVFLEYIELPGVGHGSWVDAYANAQIFDWFARFERIPFPNRVRHVAYNLKRGKAYWVRMDQKVSSSLASVDARFAGMNQIEIATTNVLGFTLLLDGHPKYEAGVKLLVTVDGIEVEINAPVDYVHFSRGSGSWENQLYHVDGQFKKAGLEGPIIDAFGERHIYVYGTADDPSPEVLQERKNIATEAADWAAYRGAFLGRIMFFPRVVPDTWVRTSDFESSNLILFGNAETNRIIAKYANQLPMQLTSKAEKKYGLVFAFPNEYDHYLVINSGLPWWYVEEETDWRYQPQKQTSLGKLKDFTLFSKDREVMIQGYFDEAWKLKGADRKALSGSGVLR
jgi:pimeloyl-ACP methyl ester carboxylesterase